LWAIVTLSTLVVIIILILCIPLDIAFHIDFYGRPSFRIRLIWLFGLVSKELGKGKKEPEKKRKRRELRTTARTIFEIIRIKGLVKKFCYLVKDIFSHINVRELRANFKLGLDDPADTALFFGPIYTTTLFIRSFCSHEITVQPSFDGEAVCEGYIYAAARLRPIQLVTPLMRFAFSLATIRAVKILVLSKWKRKR